jgi:flagellar assembly factor FliW
MKSLEFGRSSALEINQLNRCVLKDVDPEVVVRFQKGLPGFEDLTEFVFIAATRAKPFVFMQSIKQDDCCFICVDPFLIMDGYSVTMNQASCKRLGLDDPLQARVFSIVTVDEKKETVTANLKSPVLVNFATLQGEQIILEDADWPIRYDIWQAIENRQIASCAS